MLNVSNVSLSSGLNRLNSFGPCQKFVTTGNKMNLSSDKHRVTASLLKVPPLRVRVYLILEIHNTLFADRT